ncbi:S-formylglutathione hydrolase FrmB [Kibdelosporangium banguiense]|uniref:S-formylglutathione hydrolase FrmB n=1 Tax=Kibdelosporangium banguiense TaxID=1365924 RepID=A0ABS4TNV6_9PSEU|nr:alpha/beta hydrolase family protein [Kibdelosporangium banguiense]MBP2326089.1 S-formylglutathione hydrolase FrmB [Kibdelosporangium banguiense]
MAPEVVSRVTLGPRLVEYELYSPTLREPTALRILFPAAYGENTARFPVLYLLHGGDDDYRAWTDKGGAAEATQSLPVIVVMPNARNGFYSDWVKPGRYGRTAWETFHIGELVPWVDSTFRTEARRESRALAGLSMGGFGAMSYAARHPDLFSAAASFSGALDTNVYTFIPGIAARRDGGARGSIWGDRATNATRWRAHNPWDLAANLRGMTLAVRTRTGLPGPLDRDRRPDPVEAIVFHESLRFHRRLAALGIGHTWHYGPGTHDWPYWAVDLRETLPILHKAFLRPPPIPSPVTHVSAEPSYRAYGWEVRVSPAHMEFSQLSDADKNGFSLTGRGIAHVRTPALFEPDRTCTVTIDQLHTELTADSAGRLDFRLQLGRRKPGTVRVRIGVA